MFVAESQEEAEAEEGVDAENEEDNSQVEEVMGPSSDEGPDFENDEASQCQSCRQQDLHRVA
jgi:hypothetical protein